MTVPEFAATPEGGTAEDGPSSKKPRSEKEDGPAAKKPRSEEEEPVLVELVELEARWQRLHESTIRELQERAAANDGAWADALQQAMAPAARSDSDLESETQALTKERYGEDAALFFPLPPSVARLLPVASRSSDETAFSDQLQGACEQLGVIREQLLAHLTVAKSRQDREALRALGPKHGKWGKDVKELRALDAKVSRRVNVSAKRITAYRLKQLLREIDPLQLRGLEASMTGYTKVLDFYRHTDPRVYSFGRQFEGVQHFADIRRNVAILEVFRDGAKVFEGLAVSGLDGPGVRPSDAARSLFRAIEAKDGLGETYLRDQDAEFKLCASFCGDSGLLPPPQSAEPESQLCAEFGRASRAVLFSKKPLCASCHDVVHTQLLLRVPGMALTVVIDEPEAVEHGSSSCCDAVARPAS